MLYSFGLLVCKLIFLLFQLSSTLPPRPFTIKAKTLAAHSLVTVEDGETINGISGMYKNGQFLLSGSHFIFTATMHCYGNHFAKTAQMIIVKR